MPYTVTLPDDLFTSVERDRLQDLFRSTGKPSFDDGLQAITSAAVREYVDTLLGNGQPLRADELQQHRLHHLIAHYFADRLPSETEVAALFHLTANRARSLIRAVITRFHHDHTDQLKSSLARVLTQATFEKQARRYCLDIQSAYELEELNHVLGIEHPGFDQIRKVKNTVRKFALDQDAYEALCTYFGVTPVPAT